MKNSLFFVLVFLSGHLVSADSTVDYLKFVCSGPSTVETVYTLQHVTMTTQPGVTSTGGLTLEHYTYENKVACESSLALNDPNYCFKADKKEYDSWFVDAHVRTATGYFNVFTLNGGMVGDDPLGSLLQKTLIIRVPINDISSAEFYDMNYSFEPPPPTSTHFTTTNCQVQDMLENIITIVQ